MAGQTLIECTLIVQIRCHPDDLEAVQLFDFPSSIPVAAEPVGADTDAFFRGRLCLDLADGSSRWFSLHEIRDWHESAWWRKGLSQILT